MAPLKGKALSNKITVLKGGYTSKAVIRIVKSASGVLKGNDLHTATEPRAAERRGWPWPAAPPQLLGRGDAAVPLKPHSLKSFRKRLCVEKVISERLKNALTPHRPPAPLPAVPALPGQQRGRSSAGGQKERGAAVPRSPAPGGAGGAGPGGDRACGPRRAGRPSPSARQSCAGEAGAGPGAAPRPRTCGGRSAGNGRGGRSGIAPPPPPHLGEGSRGAARGAGGRAASLPPCLPPRLPAAPGPSLGRGALSRAARGTKERRATARGARPGAAGRPGHGGPGGPARARPRRAHSPLQHQEEGEPCGNLAESGAMQTLEPRCGHSMAGRGGAAAAAAGRAAPRGATAAAPRAQQPS